MAPQGLLDGAKEVVASLFGGGSKAAPPSDEKVEIIDGEKYYKAALEAQKPYHPVWYRNIAGYAGQMWLDWNNQSNWFQETSAPSWRVRLTHNLILPMVRAAIAQELESNPRFFAMPSNNEPASKGASRTAGRVLEAKYFEDDFFNMFKRLRLWTRMTGSAWIFALKDKSAGKAWSDVVKDPTTGAPVVDEATGQPKMQDYAEGDVCYSVDNSFEVLLDPEGPEDFNLHQRLMRVRLMSISKIKDNWNVDVPAEQVTLDIMYQVRVMSLVDASGRSRSTTAEGSLLKNMALVKHMFELPTKAHPNGREWIYSNGVVLEPIHDVDYWYKGKRAIPAGMSNEIEIPGRCHGASGIEQVLPINVQINKMSSMVVENGNLMSRPKYKAPRGSVEDDQITDQPGEVVEYVPGPNGQGPEVLTPPEMPQYFFQKYQELKELMKDIYGMHDASTGRLPRRATSGVAIDALQNADEAPIGLSMRSCGAALTRVFSISLRIMQDLYTEERMVRMVGRDHQVDVIQFKGADLKGCDFVRVDFGSQLTRAQRIQLGMQMAENKMISPDKLFELMENGNINVLYDKDSFQKNYAKMENMQLAKGIPQIVGPADEHDAHIKEHLDDAQAHADEAPEIAAVRMMHIDEHKAKKMEAMAPSGPMAPPPGLPPPPMPEPGAPQ